MPHLMADHERDQQPADHVVADLRLLLNLDDAHVRVVLTHEPLLAKLPEFGGHVGRVFERDFEVWSIKTSSGRAARVSVRDPVCAAFYNLPAKWQGKC